MSDEGSFTIHLDHVEGYEFRVRFDWDDVGEVAMDEPSPLGTQKGPNAARMLAAAAANCLSASLLYCVSKKDAAPQSLKTTVTCRMVRNEKNRLRVGDLVVDITLSGELGQSARLHRCLELFEDFCVVSGSIRQGIPVGVRVLNESGDVLHESDPAAH